MEAALPSAKTRRRGKISIVSQPFTKAPITIPRKVLKQAGIRPGAWLGFIPGDGVITIRIENPIWHTVVALSKNPKAGRKHAHAPR